MEGVLAGLLGGAGVGVFEALAVLSAAGSSSDFVALFYAALLYGLAGAALGAPLGLVFALAQALGRGLSRHVAWTLSFLAVSCALAWWVAQGQLRTAGVEAGGLVLGLLGVYAALGLLFLPKLLSQTPLKVLRELKGSAAAWGALLVVTAVFSFAPGASLDGTLRPDKGQGPEFRGRPNLLLIVVDSLRADHVGAYGGRGLATPAMDRLAADGVLFERARAQAVDSRSSLSTLLSATLPSVHGAGRRALPDASHTLAEQLSEGGYVTGGLPNSGEVTRSFNLHQGFDYYHYLAPDLPLWGTESVHRLQLYLVLRRALEARDPGRDPAAWLHQPAPAAVEAAQRFIDAQGEARWFLMLHLVDPLAACLGRERCGGPQDQGKQVSERYVERVESMDLALGELLQWLEATGRYEDTLVVLTATHGMALGERGRWGPGGSLYEEQLRVPLILKLPRGELAGTRAAWDVREVDIAPTLAQAAGVIEAGDWTGEGLLEDAERAALREPGVDPEPLRRETLAELDEGRAVAFLSGDWKLVYVEEGDTRGLPPVGLYNLRLDPRERTNVAARNGARVTTLSEAMREALAAGAAGDADGERLRALGYGERTAPGLR